MIPGEVFVAEGSLTLNADRPAIALEVENTGDRPIQVGSHFHFFEANHALHFERPLTYGHRLDIPSGSAVRFEPGERVRVTLIPVSGHRVIVGFTGAVNGPLDAI